MKNIIEKVAIVTGAARNIGRATCLELAKLNFNILVHANTDKDGAEETSSLVKNVGVKSKIFIGDLTDINIVNNLIKNSYELGNLSVLVNNASQRNFFKFEDMAYEDWRKILSINLLRCHSISRMFFLGQFWQGLLQWNKQKVGS